MLGCNSFLEENRFLKKKEKNRFLRVFLKSQKKTASNILQHESHSTQSENEEKTLDEELHYHEPT